MTIDTHAHAWDATCRIVPAHYTPGAPRPVSHFLTAMDLHEVEAGVLVQPSFLGTDNSYLRACLRANPSRLRGVAVIDGRFRPGDIDAMQHEGVIGIRFNLLGGDDLPDFSAGNWPRLLRAMERQRWSLELGAPGPRLPALLPVLQGTGMAVVVDHFGLPDPALGLDCPGFRHLLRAVDDNDGPWIKVSAPYRLGGLDPAPLIAALRDAGALLVWGSDFPHTRHEDQTYAAQLAWATDDMHENAAVLYDLE